MQILSTMNLIDMWPIQLETMSFFYESKLKEIQWSACDILETIKPHPLLDSLQSAALIDLYDILLENNNIYLFDDIIDPDTLAILCHNYSVIGQALDSHYSNDIPRIDRNVLRDLRNSSPSLN